MPATAVPCIERRRRVVRLVDRRERHDAGEVRARAIDAAVDHGDRDRVRGHRQHVGVRERVDGGEVPLARAPADRWASRPACARPRAARARARRGTCRRRASARASDRPWRARGSGTLRRARVVARATHVQRPRTTCCSATEPRAPRGYSRPCSRAPGRPRRSRPDVPDHGHGGRRERARDEPVARRLADRAPEGERAGAVVGHLARDDVAPAVARGALERRRAGRRRPVSSTRLRTTRACSAIFVARGSAASGETVNHVERRPRRLRASAARQLERPGAAVQRDRPHAARRVGVDVHARDEARVDRLLREVAVARARASSRGTARSCRTDRRRRRGTAPACRPGRPPRPPRCARPRTTRST